MTARMLRKDRPIHLLGIGGVRDIFHGVRQGEPVVVVVVIVVVPLFQCIDLLLKKHCRE